jgi:hypothetical protein
MYIVHPLRILIYRKCVATLKKVREDIKGNVHEMNILFNKQVLSEHALIVFTIFCFLVDEKIKFKVLACSFEITF